MSISTTEELREHLQTAIELEHSTLPPYLCALYSIRPGSNSEVAAVIQSVVMEEMLHMVLAANLLNSINGKPSVNHPKFIPTYPGYLPHSDRSFQVSLLKFGKPALESFKRIEKPAKPDAPPEDDNYRTIGQFYEAIAEGFRTLHSKMGQGLFCGKSENQICPDTWYYGGGGRVIEVTDLASAMLAIEEIEAQGEGLSHTIFDGDKRIFEQSKEVAHYFRFNEILLEREYTEFDTAAGGPTGATMPTDWNAVYNMRPNPHEDDYSRRPDIAALVHEFNCLYMDLLDLLQDGFNGYQQQLLQAVPKMYQIKNKAIALMKIPSGDGETTVGPSFRYVPPEHRKG